MSLWDDPKFSEPTDEVGDWHFARSVCFADEQAPTAMKHAIEKLTGQLLQREPFDPAAPALRYAGTSGAGGNPSTLRVELIAIDGGRHLYRLTSEGSAARRWTENQRFIADCERRLAHWCRQLRIVANEHDWPSAPRASFERAVLAFVAAEEAAARVVADPAPVVALQREVLDALRNGMGFFTAGKEGGSHLFYDGGVFRRNDYGESTECAVYPDDASMVDCLRRFYDWESRRDSYPHPKPELEVWRYIQGQLRPR